jgi:hypothetical protein
MNNQRILYMSVSIGHKRGLINKLLVSPLLSMMNYFNNVW